jgi:isoleucyl-tRNA synthetase
LGKDVQRIIQAAKAGDWSDSGGVVTAGGTDLVEGEYELTLETAPAADGAERALTLLSNGGFVLLDTATTPELEAEGLARDLIRAIQDTRKSAGFEVSDRINLDLVFFDEADAVAVRSVAGVDIADETLATALTVHSPSTTNGLAQVSEQLPVEWIGSVASVTPEHLAPFTAGVYANAGAFVVAVSRVNRVVNV